MFPWIQTDLFSFTPPFLGYFLVCPLFGTSPGLYVSQHPVCGPSAHCGYSPFTVLGLCVDQRHSPLSTSPRCCLASAGMFTGGGSAHCGRHTGATLCCSANHQPFFFFLFLVVTQNVNAAQSGQGKISHTEEFSSTAVTWVKSAQTTSMLKARVQSMELSSV